MLIDTDIGCWSASMGTCKHRYQSLNPSPICITFLDKNIQDSLILHGGFGGLSCWSYYSSGIPYMSPISI